MKTLVTGATGFLGSALVRELLNDGRDIRIIARSNADLRNVADLDLEIVNADLLDESSLRSAIKGCDTIYHAAAYYSFWDKNKRLIFDINVGGTRSLLQAALDHEVEKVVYTSTVGCLGLNQDCTPANEDTPHDPATLCNDYKLSKFQAEQTAKEFYEKGLPIVIVNPSTPIGPRDIKPTPTGKIILDFLNRKTPAYVDTGLNLIDVRDCARGHILAEEKGRIGERYILGNKNFSLKEIFQALEKITGLKAPTVKMPYWVAYAAGWSCEIASNYITRKPPAVPLGGVKMAKYFMYFDPAKAIRELGLPQNSIENALQEAVNWFRKNNMVKS
ncbi:MAG: hopanoid-associated sugar epimerase [Nitrospinales bacterium]